MKARPKIISKFVAIALAAAVIGTPAFADPIRCTTFLHNRDGSWRSFNEADVDGPDGVLHIRAGEILRSSERSEKGDVARALDDLCGDP